jgi:hypothetical protein
MLINFNPDFSFLQKIFTPNAWKKIGGIIGLCAIIIPATLFISSLTSRAKLTETLAIRSTYSDSLILNKLDKVDEKVSTRLHKMEDSISIMAKNMRITSSQVSGFKASYISHLEGELILSKDNKKVMQDILNQIHILNYMNYFYTPRDTTRIFLVKNQDN